MTYSNQHPFVTELEQNLRVSPQFIQVIMGPRQVGKTTGVQQFLSKYKKTYHEASADEAKTEHWLEEQWQLGQDLGDESLIVIDEIQKIPDWSAKLKTLWDKKVKSKKKNKLVVLGSSSLQIQKGLTESLTGRFQIIRVYHWDFLLSQKIFKLSFDNYFEYGGYPGSYSLIGTPAKWKAYIADSIIETVIGKDILSLAQIRNPALFKQCFHLLASLPAQSISYTKLLGQLHDRGNTDLIKHYIALFEGAFLFKTIPKYSKAMLRKKTSSPKIIPLCPALIDRDIYTDPIERGRAFEAIVGAQLIQADLSVTYWSDGNFEVDYVVEIEKMIFAIEVKSGRNKTSKSLAEFGKQHPKFIPVFISKENFSVFAKDPEAYLRSKG